MNIKRISAAILLALLALCLFGCSSVKGFTRAGVIDVARDHGMIPLDSSGDVRSLIAAFESCQASSCYAASNQAEAQSLYDRYFNASNKYPLYEVNDFAILITVDKRLKDSGESVANLNEDHGKLILLSLDSEAGAQKLFEMLVNEKFSNTTPAKGKKNGYSYAADFSYVEEGKSKIGVYVKGKNVLIIEGMSFGKGDYFGDYVFRELGILDPGDV
ncbi:MAG: hypothetical protein J5623_00215 [Clostridiales bacterium]|nr:hypothetical protein [Clostridiales bacterium]